MIRRAMALMLAVSILSPAFAQVDVLDRADSLSARFEYGKATEAYRSAAPANEYRRLNGLSKAENFLGLDLLASGKRDSAKVHFGLALETAERMVNEYPDSADSHFNLAAAKGNLALLSGPKAKVSMGRDVEEHALRAVALDSMHSDALSVLGVFYREVAQLSWLERLAANTLFGGVPSGSLEKSEGYLRKALAADPQSAFAAYELGRTLLVMDRRTEAIELYERLGELPPQDSEDLRNMAEAKAWLQDQGSN